MVNGSDNVAMSDFERLVESVPACGPLCQVSAWVDPLHGIEVQQISGGNLLEKPQFRSTVLIQSPKGPIPINFAIEATTVHEAQLGWRSAAQSAIRDFDEKMRAAQRRVIVPGVAANIPLRAS